jgi:serine/threonine protein kinase
MDTARFLRLREIFDQAIGVPATERRAYLDRECAGDAELRAEAEALWEAYAGLPSASATAGIAPPPGSSDQTIGSYRIQRRIGEGGMGSVFLAVRDDGAFRKQVALKILRRDQVSPELVKRFHQERQVLANLDHPNIARIVDGGQTPEDLPYYVMDYVEGAPLTAFCDERKLDLAGRVRIFQQLCHAVHYLHENLVIHRDLKPSNILVTSDGTVKLLDFGIAKLQIPAAGDMTSPYNRMMTPAYASPEQFAGAPVTRASDIYSLGVILYELLTGTQPFADPGAKLHVDPPAPSRGIRQDINRTPETTAQLRRRIVGDLDHIVLMSLDRDPRRRYNSAAELAEDLQRFLEGRTVVARPGHFTERAIKFVKRNRIAVAVCTLLVALALFGAWQAVEAQVQSRRAMAKESEVARLLDTLNRSSARASGVRQVREAMERNFPRDSAGGPAGPSTAPPERRELFMRVLRYLDSLRADAAADSMLASELAQSYQSLGVLAEPLYPDLALSAFQNAAAVFLSLSAGDPAAGPYRAQWQFVASRIRALGGTVPEPVHAATPVTLTADAPRTSARAVSSRNRAAASDTAEPAFANAAPQPEPIGVDPAVRQEVMSRFSEIRAVAQTADRMMEQMNASAAKLNQAVHPDIVKAHFQMQSAMEEAQREMESGNFDGAREKLERAEAWARRVIKAGGG